MLLFHGSNCLVEHPDINIGRSGLDFGKGFYVTTFKEQAIRWARYKQHRKGGKSVVSVYEFDEVNAKKHLNIYCFSEFNKEWLLFVRDCRLNRFECNYDIVIGAVANDKVYETYRLFEEGYYNEDETLKRIKMYELNNQLCFKSFNSLKYLIFKEII